MILLFSIQSLREGTCCRASIRLLYLWKTLWREVSWTHLWVHTVLGLGRDNVLLIIVIATESVCIWLLESTIKRWHLSLQTASHVTLKHRQLRGHLLSFIVLDIALLYVPILIFFRRRARNLSVFGDEGCLELLYLLVVFHFLAFNLGLYFLSICWNILLHRTRRSVDGFGCLAVKGRPWDLWSTLHL